MYLFPQDRFMFCGGEGGGSHKTNRKQSTEFMFPLNEVCNGGFKILGSKLPKNTKVPLTHTKCLENAKRKISREV